ncbi:MAG: ferritin family protein [bacterium]
MEFEGSKTQKNLQSAFAGESQARNKYTYYAQQAKADGYMQISKIFEETANNEKEHAKIWFKLLHEGNKVPDTLTNLEDAANGEHYEYTEMYPTFAKEAKEEGFDKIAFLFESVAKIEKEHNERYQKLHANVAEGTVFEKKEKVFWICLNCGHILENVKAVEVCPVCVHPKSYFAMRTIDY